MFRGIGVGGVSHPGASRWRSDGRILASLQDAISSLPVVRWYRCAQPPYSFSGLILRLGWELAISDPAQPVNKSVRMRQNVDNLVPAPIRISTAARLTSSSRVHRSEPEPRSGYAYSGADAQRLILYVLRPGSKSVRKG